MKQKTLSVSLISASLLIGCASNNDSNHENKVENNSLIDGAPKDIIAEQPAILEEHVVYDDIQTHATHVYAKRKMAESQKADMAQTQSILLAAPQPSQRFIPPQDHLPATYQDHNRENYASIEQSSIKQVSQHPVSTFSIDVDTGSYSNIRRMLNHGALPPVDAVRIEEMINYFDYSYTTPEIHKHPFSIDTELAMSPWSNDHALLRIGVKGYEPQLERSKANLVFLLDVSGSMNAPNKLPLLKKSLIMLSKQLSENDTVSIVVYAGASGVVLEPTPGNQTLDIERALNQLSAGGSTNGQAGIQLAYQLAKQNFDKDGINRVILATDGDFNVGTSDVDSLKKLIKKKRSEGIALTTLGFGTGNYNDHLMEQIADVGNGNYAYIDNLNEARKVLVEELDSTLMTIAKDVKIQVEFNPSTVTEYRLIGYENRALKREDFNNDKVDAGEIGAGHSVTALYELVLADSTMQRVDPLRYQAEPDRKATAPNRSNELAFVKFRYKKPDSETSTLISEPILRPKQLTSFDEASTDFRFSSTVAHFGEALRESKYLNELDYQRIIAHAQNAKGEDTFGYRSEFIQLVRLASNL